MIKNLTLTLCLALCMLALEAGAASISTSRSSVFAGDTITAYYNLGISPAPGTKAYILLSGASGSFGGGGDTLKVFTPNSQTGSYLLRIPTYTHQATTFRLRLVYATATPQIANSSNIAISPDQYLEPLKDDRSRKPLDLIRIKTIAEFDSVALTLKAIIFPGVTYSVNTFYFDTKIINPYDYRTELINFFNAFGASAVGLDFDYIAYLRLYKDGKAGALSAGDTFGVVRDPAGDTIRLDPAKCGVISASGSNSSTTVIEYTGTSSSVKTDENVLLRDGYAYTLYRNAALTDSITTVYKSGNTIFYDEFGDTIQWCASGELSSKGKCTACSNTFYLVSQYYIYNVDSSKRLSAKPMKGCAVKRKCNTASPIAAETALDDNGELQLFPNPTAQEVTIRLNAGDGKQYQILILNSAGQVMHQETRIAQGAGQHFYSIEAVKDLPAGEYYTVVRGASSTQSSKFVKVK